MMLSDSGHLAIDGARLEYRMTGPRPDAAPTIVMLHEGLGSVGTWGEFPQKLAEKSGLGVFLYSRAGYGKSSSITLPRPLDYMQREAAEVLPKLLDAIGFRRGILLGHSDGASIAAQYAGSHQDHRVRGLVLMAPHFFVEPESLAEIRNARTSYETTDLRARLARHHADVDAAFRGWNEAWLDPRFSSAFEITDALAYIRVPILIVQGENEQYGTVRQIEVAQEECYCPVEVALLRETRHAPYYEAPEATLQAISEFANRLLHDHREGDLAAHAAE